MQQWRRRVRIWQINDLHMEHDEVVSGKTFGDLPDADVAVVVGDLSDFVEDNIDWCSRVVRPKMPVVYVPGNHDMYGKCIYSDIDDLRAFAAGRGVTFLEKDVVVVGGARFVGGLLWSNYELWAAGEDEERETLVESRLVAAQEKPDYKRIYADRPAGRLMSPWDSRRRHKETISFIRRELSRPFDGPTVVATHFPVHVGSLQPQYVGDHDQPRYLSDHCSLIEETQPDFWLHGHTHHAVSYRVGRTVVSNNPRGYSHEKTGFDWALVHQVETARAIAA
jgi:Icc-related predicted phosphoesterase